ncbi:MAG: PAS domain S-box protein [Candidatus Binatia bacterium]
MALKNLLVAQQELQESQRAFSTLVSILPGMAYRCSSDRDWTMQFVSEGCLDLTGYQPDELVKNRKLAYARLIHPDDRERVWNEVQVALQDNRPFRIVYRIITAAGEEKWVWEQGCGVFSSDRGLLALEGFITDITERKQAEEVLQHRTHDLGERVKELTGLYSLSKIFNRPNLSLEKVLEATVEILLPAWHYPEITCARIIFDGREFTTGNFEETIWRQASDIVICGKQSGTVEVFYLEEKPKLDEGPFLKEERNLIDEIAARLGETIERMQVAEALQRERDFAENLIETAQVIVLVLDKNGRIVRFNPYMEKISGYRLDEVQGKDWFTTFLPESDKSRIRELFLNVVSETETRGVNPIITKNGQERHIEWSSKILKGAGGNVVGVLSIGQDITEKNRLQKQLMESERLAAIGATAAKLAHEIGNPLNGMYMTAQLLDRRLARQVATLEDTVRSTVQKLKDEIARLDNLLREFGSLARREKYSFRPISLATLCGEIYALEQDNFNALHIHFEQDFPKDLPLVLADSDRLQQVLLNLCKNAVEAMPQGGTLAVQAHNSGEHVVVEIVDTGVGIPPELDIFEPFTTTKPSGTGLGLMIVRQIVSAHGGTITYDSQPGKGTTFRLTLPLYPSPQKSVEGLPVGRKD